MNQKIDHFAYWTLLMLGFCTGLPWGVVTNSGHLFESRLKGTSYGDAFISHFATIFLLVQVTFLLVSVNTKNVRADQQLIISAPILAFLMLGFAGICATEAEKLKFYGLVLSLSSVLSLFLAMFKAGGFGVVGALSDVYLRAFLIGEGVTSVVMALYSLVSDLAGFQVGRTQALVTFGLSAIVILASLFAYLKLKTKAGFHIQMRSEIQVSTETDVAKKEEKSSFSKLFLKVWKEAAAAFLSGVVSLFIFSYFLPHTESVHPGTRISKIFRPLAMLLFPLGDLAGKMLPTIAFFNCPPLLKLTLSRLGLLPLFLLGTGTTTNRTRLFKSDLFFFFLVFTASASGGYTSSMASVMAPQRVVPEERGRISTIMAAVSLLGNLFGSFFSAIFAYILAQTN